MSQVFGKIVRAPEESWTNITAGEHNRMTTQQRKADYIKIRRIAYNSGTWWQRFKRDVRRWLAG